MPEVLTVFHDKPVEMDEDEIQVMRDQGLLREPAKAAPPSVPSAPPAAVSKDKE
jgi:hypothetical protein